MSLTLSAPGKVNLGPAHPRPARRRLPPAREPVPPDRSRGHACRSRCARAGRHPPPDRRLPRASRRRAQPRRAGRARPSWQRPRTPGGVAIQLEKRLPGAGRARRRLERRGRRAARPRGAPAGRGRSRPAACRSRSGSAQTSRSSWPRRLPSSPASARRSCRSTACPRWRSCSPTPAQPLATAAVYAALRRRGEFVDALGPGS